MFRPFQLKKTIGETYDMDLEDSLNAKKALARLGHLDVPEDGLDEYPDRPMIEAVKSFQRAQGLTEDGVMKPDGPTLERLNASLVARDDKPRPRGSIIADPRRNPEPPVTPINLKRPVTPSTSVDLGDIGRIKSVLEVLGLPLPGGTADPYPTHDLFKTIRAFQRRENLVEDGEMKPGGETEARMNEVLNRTTKASRATRVQAEHATGLPMPEQETDAGTPRPDTPDDDALKSDTVTVGGKRLGLDGLSEKLAAWDAIVRSGATDEAGASYVDEAPEDLRREVGEALLGILPGTGEALEAKEAYDAFQAAREALRRGDLSDAGINAALAGVSAAGAIPVIGKGPAYAKKIVRLLARGIEAATDGRKVGQAAGAAALGTTGALTRDTPRDDKTAATAERMDIAPPMPPLPGFEPIPEEDRGPRKTEFPAEPIRIPTIVGPVPKLEKPAIFITPAPKPGEFGPQILESKGGPQAKKQIDELRDQFLEANPDCTHVGGGRSQEDGSEVTEFYTAGPGRAFPRPGKEFGDGRQGSARLDLSFRCGDGKTYVHYQTVDVDKDGNVTRREWDNALRAWKNLNERREGYGEIHHIRMVPKTWMLKRK